MDPFEAPRPQPVPAAPPPPPLFSPRKPRPNGKAVAALALGICSLFIIVVGFVLSILAIVLAAVAFKEIDRTGERGRGMATAGLVLGIVSTVIHVALFVIIVILFFFSISESDTPGYFYENVITAMA